MSSQPDSSRASRWSNKTANTSTGSMTGNYYVTDEEALQALLASAQEREQEERTSKANNRKRGRDDRDRRPQEEGRPLKDQRLVENDSYYGPREASSKQREEKTREDDDESKPSHKPNFGLSGALSKDKGGNVYKGVLLKFQEPAEARAPNTQWRFYVFKGKSLLETLHISKQSAYLFGRNEDICDIHMAHPSLSGQHAVLQYRALPQKETGRLSCQPYIMDLESTNGTFLNEVKIDPARYYQLKKGDVLTFGGSTREYVLLTENTTELR